MIVVGWAMPVESELTTLAHEPIQLPEAAEAAREGAPSKRPAADLRASSVDR
jgi:hypothetical protein